MLMCLSFFACIMVSSSPHPVGFGFGLDGYFWSLPTFFNVPISISAGPTLSKNKINSFKFFSLVETKVGPNNKREDQIQRCFWTLPSQN